MRKIILLGFALACMGVAEAQNPFSAIHSAKVEMAVGQSFDFGTKESLLRGQLNELDSLSSRLIWSGMKTLAEEPHMRLMGAGLDDDPGRWSIYQGGMGYYRVYSLEDLWPNLGHEQIMEVLKSKTLREVIYRWGIKLVGDLCRIMPGDFRSDLMVRIDEAKSILQKMKGHVFEQYTEYDDEGYAEEILYVDGSSDWDVEVLFAGVEDFDLLFFLVRRVVNNDVPVQEMLSALNRLSISLNLDKAGSVGGNPQNLSSLSVNDDFCLIVNSDDFMLKSTRPYGDDSDLENMLNGENPFDLKISMLREDGAVYYRFTSKRGGRTWVTDRRGRVMNH